MPATLTYLLQVNAAILVFYLLYRLVFRALTFYSINRYFLLFGLFFSLFYPFIEVAPLFNRPINISSTYNFALQAWSFGETQQQPLQTDYWPWIQGLFWCVSILLLLRLLVRLCSLYSFHTKTTPAQYKGYRFRKVSQPVHPFSFWNTIYLNPECHQQEELSAILQHEQVHLEEYHTGDVLLAEILLLLCWFNPAMWLTKRAIGENLEFITDQRLLQKGMESKTYQYCLLKISKLSQASSLAINFNFLTIKTRIGMMNKKRTTPMHRLKYALMIPLLSVLVYACNVTNEPAEVKIPQEQNTLEQLTDSEPTYFLNGKEVSLAEIGTLNPEDIATVNVYKDEEAINKWGEKGVNGVVAITTKANSQPKDSQVPSPNIDNSPVKIKIKGEGIGSAAATNDMSEAYVMIDGKEASIAAMESLSPDQIGTVDITKGQEAVARWGAKAEKGAISITTKK